MPAKTQYGLKRATTGLPWADLLVVPHRDTDLVVGFPGGSFAFGPNSFSSNRQEMDGSFYHSPELPQLTFRTPTTAESLAAAAYEFPIRAKPRIFDDRALQTGWIVRATEGVFVNPPEDEKGNPITDERVLTSYLDGTTPRKVREGQVYVVPTTETLRDFGFAEYGSFQTGIQDADTFTTGGLALILDHAEEGSAALNLRGIAALTQYPEGVGVYQFDPVKKSELKVAALGSGWDRDENRLLVSGGVGGDEWFAFAFGAYDPTTQKVNLI